MREYCSKREMQRILTKLFCTFDPDWGEINKVSDGLEGKKNPFQFFLKLLL